MSGSGSKNSKYGSSSSHKHGKTAAAQNHHDADASGIVHIPFQRTTSKQFSTYNSALQRSPDDCLAVEDLDNIQLELEQLLSNVAIRYRILKSEYESIDKDDRKNERKHKHNEKPPASPAPPPPTTTVNKRKRDESSSVRKPKHSANVKNTKSKNSPAALNTDDSVEYTIPPATVSQPHGPNRDHHLQKLPVPKNDTPNKFWLSVEPFCMPITNEDLRMIDDLLEQYAGPLVPPIPDLGPHYSDTWALEDLKEIQQNSNPNNRSKPLSNNEAANMLKKAESCLEEEETITGSLTQRLVSALMEEQVLQQSPAEFVAECSNSSSENTSSSQSNFKSLSMMKNCIGLEKRLKKELFDQGILDSLDFPSDDEDEILNEINRLVAELTTIAEYNSSSLKRLRAAALDEMKRLEIKRRLDMIDQEILETYKRTMQNKSKKKALTQEEQLEIVRLTTEQKKLSELLERSQAEAVIFG